MGKVCFLINSMEPGGVEQYLLRFLTFSQGKMETMVVCKSGQTGQLYQQYGKLNVRIIPFRTGYFSLIAWIKFYFFLKRERVDTVCDFTGNFAGIYLMISKVARIPKRIVFYRQSSNHFRPNFFRLAYNDFVNLLVECNATAILSNSFAALDFFFPRRHKDDSRFEVIYNGIDSKLFCGLEANSQATRSQIGIPNNVFVVGNTGRFTAAKNHATILKVAFILTAKYPNIIFVLCGRDTDGGELKGAINRMGLQEKVICLGYRRDVNRILSTFDLFYFPSITEGQPNSLIEAIISGVPIVASSIKPIVEMLPESLYQQLVDPFDVLSACKKIEQYYISRQNDVFEKSREWSIRFFDAENRFQQFLNKL